MPRVNGKRPVSVGDYFFGAMLFIITGIMPLMVRGFKVPAAPEVQLLFDGEYYYDHLAYLKSWLVILPAGLTVFYFISELVTGGFKGVDFKKIIKDPMIVSVLVFLFMSAVSAVFSKYPHTAFFGTIERFEGFIMLLSYMAVFITAFFYLREERYMLPVMAGLIFSSVVMGAIGIGQFLGYDFFDTALAQTFAAGEAGAFAVKFDIAFGTLYNPNTYGLYSAMMFPFLLLCGFTYNGKKWINALMLFAGLLMLGGIAASNSLGGLIGAVAAAAILLITYTARLIYNKEKPPRAAGFSLLAAFTLLACALLFVPPVRQRMTGFADKFINSMTMGDADLPNYKTDGNKFIVENADGSPQLTLEFAESPWLTVRDGGGNETAYQSLVYDEDASAEDRNDLNPYNATAGYNVPGYGPISVYRIQGGMVITFLKYGTNNKLLLSYADGKVTALLRDGITPVDINEPVPSIGFKNNEMWATMRGYIWSRSFPLMLKYPIIGSGPDSFLNEFPQHDLAGKMRMYNLPYIVVDKAHNLYIQTWITTGGISALALMFLFGYYLTGTFVSLIKSKGENRFLYGVRLGLLAGIGAFCVSSLSTDSTVASSGVFYVLLGLGYAANVWAKRATRTTAAPAKAAR